MRRKCPFGVLSVSCVTTCHNLSQPFTFKSLVTKILFSAHERDDNCILTIFDPHFSNQPNHFSHSEDGSSTFVQNVEILPMHGAQTQNKTTISITLFYIFFVFVNRLYFQLFQSFFVPFVVKVCTGCYSDKFNLDRCQFFLLYFIRVKISLPHKRMGTASTL
jgi:hypothetical protein